MRVRFADLLRYYAWPIRFTASHSAAVTGWTERREFLTSTMSASGFWALMAERATGAFSGAPAFRSTALKAPLGSVVDKEGRPSTETADFYDGGALTTFGAHKGFGLSVMIE